MDRNSSMQTKVAIRPGNSRQLSTLPEVINILSDSEDEIMQDSQKINSKRTHSPHSTVGVLAQVTNRKRHSSTSSNEGLARKKPAFLAKRVSTSKVSRIDPNPRCENDAPRRKLRPLPDRQPLNNNLREMVRRTLVRPSGLSKTPRENYADVGLSWGSIRDTGISIYASSYAGFVEHRPSAKPKSQVSSSSVEMLETQDMPSSSSSLATNSLQRYDRATKGNAPITTDKPTKSSISSSISRITTGSKKVTSTLSSQGSIHKDQRRVENSAPRMLISRQTHQLHQSGPTPDSITKKSRNPFLHYSDHASMSSTTGPMVATQTQMTSLNRAVEPMPSGKTSSSTASRGRPRKQSSNEISTSTSDLQSIESAPRGQRNLRTRKQNQTAAMRQREEWSSRYQDHQFLEQIKALNPPVDIINELDDDPPPANFRFISKNRFTGRAIRPDPDAIYGCSCGTITCSFNDCDCIHERNIQLKPNGQPWGQPYNQYGRLSNDYLESDLAIFECNHKCKCPSTCRNRLVQKGRQFSFEIFKTETRGWGLRSSELIRKGSFVDTYRGEILTEAEAMARSSKSSVNDLHFGGASGSNNMVTTRKTKKDIYLFDLDKFQDTIDELAPNQQQIGLYVIDGEFLGSPARFINHSCEPNLRVFAVSMLRGNPRVYELAFFAIRDIPPGEELCFDYRHGVEDEDEDGDDDNGKAECLCGADSCRGRFW